MATKAPADSETTAPPRAYVVTHSMVGPHYQGEVVTFPDDSPTRAEVERLLRLGAIRPAREDEASRALPYTMVPDDRPVYVQAVHPGGVVTTVAATGQAATQDAGPVEPSPTAAAPILPETAPVPGTPNEATA